MKEKRDCKIVQDLLPTYIEGLTSKETNEFIEEHLQTCTECEKCYKAMKTNLTEPKEKNMRKKIDFLKKYDGKLKLFKRILITILVVFLAINIVFWGNILRKTLIIYNINEKSDKTQELEDNYYQKVTQNTDNATIVIEHYKKGDKNISFSTITLKDTGETARMIMFVDGAETNTYYEKGKEDIIKENVAGFTLIPTFNYGYDGKVWNIIKGIYAQKISIRNYTLNGKACYIINFGWTEFPEQYVDKETGLILKEDNVEYEYEFGNVDDSIFNEPDLSIYDFHGDLVTYEDISYIEIEVEDESSLDGIQYSESIKMEKHYRIGEMAIYINDYTTIEDFDGKYGAGEYFEGCPIVTFYMENGEKIFVTACDCFAEDENGEFINIIGVTKNEDFSDKVIYKVNYNLEGFIEKLYEQNK